MSIKRLILLTPYSGFKVILKKTISSIIQQLGRNDIWIIVLDNQSVEQYIDLKKKYKQLVFLRYTGPKGAGNCRNMGLDYILREIIGKFLLLPFDGDDRIAQFGIKNIKKKMKNNPFNMISLGHCKIWPNNKKKKISYSGIYNLRDLLKNYITPCGSTVLKISNKLILKKLRFSSRFRANDALFFFLAVKHFKKFKCYPEIFLNYRIGNRNSLSGKKFKMIYYKFMSLKDFGLNNLSATFYTFLYIINGIRRYYLKHNI